jgi:hypothetical protein
MAKMVVHTSYPPRLPYPVFDTAGIHALAALGFALENTTIGT